jgi:hypothetical protein
MKLIYFIWPNTNTNIILLGGKKNKTRHITIVLMHVSFKIHYRNNLIDKKDSHPIPRRPFLG